MSAEQGERRPAENGAASKNRLTTYAEDTREAPGASRPMRVAGLLRVDVSRIPEADAASLERRVQALAHVPPWVGVELVVRRGQLYPGSAVECVRASCPDLDLTVVCDDVVTIAAWGRAFREGAQPWL